MGEGRILSDLYAVIGHPIGHSLSPLMHNAAFNEMKLDAYYHAFDVPSNHLGDAVKGMKALGIRGFNVTIPHKVAIMKYLDEIDDYANAIGAVNTVKNIDGKLKGYNTDGLGYTRGLAALVEHLNKKRVLVIGAGGAARGIALSLVECGIKSLTITNRTIEKAEEILSKCKTLTKLDVMELSDAEASVTDFDVIINTTSVGLSPNTKDIPLKLDHLREGTYVSDIIYNPFYTKWLLLAQQKGAVIQNGIPMFVNQGALAFEIWTGSMPNINVMENTVIEQLGGKRNVNR
jgi:shikimate dehydrogenase